jgi:hypothetical protein
MTQIDRIEQNRQNRLNTDGDGSEKGERWRREGEESGMVRGGREDMITKRDTEIVTASIKSADSSCSLSTHCPFTVYSLFIQPIVNPRGGRGCRRDKST